MNNTDTDTDTDTFIIQPGYLFMIGFFGCWWLMCIASMCLQIYKWYKKKNNQIVESDSYSDSDSEYDDYNYTPSYHMNQQRRQNINITSVGIGYSDSECSDYEEEEYNKIETKKIKTFSNVNKYPKFCSICQENVLNSVQVDCGHSYCKECIEQYTQKNVNCPLCRKGIKNIYEIEVLIFK